MGGREDSRGVVLRDEAEDRSVWGARRHWKIRSQDKVTEANVSGGLGSQMKD